jgi:hypothetical protein
MAGRVFLNFGSCGPRGTVCFGKEVDPTDVMSSDVPNAGRLTAQPWPATSSWFRQDRPLLEQITTWSWTKPADEVIAELIRLFSEVEDYWSMGKIGKHIRLIPSLPQVTDGPLA